MPNTDVFISTLISKVEGIYENHNISCEVYFHEGIMYILYNKEETPEFNFPRHTNIAPWDQFHYELPSILRSAGIGIPYVCIPKDEIK